MAILVTGGTGKVGLQLAALLKSLNISYLLTSRTPSSSSIHPIVQFNFEDPSTYPNPFNYTFPNGEMITSAYIVAPQAKDPVTCMNAFIDFAVKRGVGRWVLLSGSSLKKGAESPGRVGDVWQHLDDVGVRYNVLLSTWINENFSKWMHADTLKNEGKIYTACGDGKVPFVSAKDIAEVVVRCLVDEIKHPEVIHTIGPELLTHDQAAEIFSNVLRRKITHIKLSPEDRTAKYVELGFDEGTAGFMTFLEEVTAQGNSAVMNDSIEKVTGKKPQTLAEWVEENKAVL